MTLHKYLTKLRKGSGQSRAEVARRCSCSVEHLRRIELGVAKPSPKLAVLLLAAVGASGKQIDAALVLLATAYIPKELRGSVEVYAPGLQDRVVRAALSWQTSTKTMQELIEGSL